MITKGQKEALELENKNIADCGGKGGVGKTTVRVNIAFGLQVLGIKQEFLMRIYP